MTSKMFSLLLVTLYAFLTFCQVTSATSCDPANFTATSVPLKQLRATLLDGGNLTVTGTVVITNGCQFTITGFTYVFAAPTTYWYGSNYTDPNALAVPICSTPVGSFQQQASVSFNLSAGISFNDFTVLKLYSMEEKLVFAQAELKPSPANPTVTNLPSAPSATTTTKASSALLGKVVERSTAVVWIVAILLYFISA